MTEFLNKMVVHGFDLSSYANIYITTKRLYHNPLIQP